MTTEKVSVSLDAALLAEARRRVHGGSSLSAYLNDALRRRLLLDQQLEYLNELDDRFGPVPPEEEEAARAWWQETKASL